MEQIKIKSYNNGFKRCEEVAMGNNFFFTAYKIWNKKEHNTDEIGDDLIKGMLPENYDEAIKMCIECIKLNDIEYKAYLSTPSMMKKEEFGEKCEMWFIKKDKFAFIEWIENLISLGKLKGKKNSSEPIKINKEITSRLALAFSTSYQIDFIPRICVVKNDKYDYFINALKPKVIQYTEKEKTIYDIELENYDDYINITAHDGFGLMNEKTANAIKDSLNLDYNVDFAVVRMYDGLMTKGLCLRFDWIDYIKKYCNDVKFINKNNTFENLFIIEDAWGKDVDLHEVDMILTTSQCKWWENFSNMQEVNELLEQCEYKDLISQLYVTKPNKQHAKKMTQTNYQLLSNLALTYDNFMKLGEKSWNVYNSMLDNNLDTIKFLLNDFKKNKDKNIEDENVDNSELDINSSINLEELTDDVLEEIDEFVQPSTKAEWLINCDDEFLKFKQVQEYVKKLVIRKICDLSAGKIMVNGSYKLIAGDPIRFINNIIGVNNGIPLDKHEFFIPRCYDKNLVISRNPLASPLEILKIKTIKKHQPNIFKADYDYTQNEKLEVYHRYFNSYSDEMIIFNNCDDTHNILSGSDEDGDGVLVVDNDIIYNAVIDPIDDRRFIHIDCDPVKMKYSKENYFNAMLKPAGNLIGQLAITGAVISSMSQQGKNIEEIKENYYKNMKYLMYLAEIEMEVIDAAKTMVMCKKEDMLLPIQNFAEELKPRFLINKDYYNFKEKGNFDVFAFSEMDKYFDYIQETLLKKYNNFTKDNKTKGNKRFSKYLISSNVNVDETDICKEKIQDLAMREDIERKNIEATAENEFQLLKKTNNKIKDYYLHYLKKAEAKKVVYKYLMVAKEIEDEYGYKVVCNVLKKLDKTDNFILKYFFNSLQLKLLENRENKMTFVWERNSEGEFEYFGETYRKVLAILEPIGVQAEQIERAKKKYDESKIKADKKPFEYRSAEISISLMPDSENYEERVKLFDNFKAWKDSVKAEIKTEIFEGAESIYLFLDNKKMCKVFTIEFNENKPVTDYLYVQFGELIKENKKSFKIKVVY